MKSYRFVLIFLLFVNILSAQNFDTDCFSIIVGKKASADGSVLVAHNEDDYGTQLVNYFKVPRQKYVKGDSIVLSTGAVILQVATTYGYLWFEMPGMNFSDSYINELGVVITSDACRSREQDGAFTDGGIKYWLRRLVAERARTAREGVKIAGALINELGYASSGRTYIIADPNEGWMLAAVQGKHWIAQRVADDEVAVLPNYYTIGSIDLADTNNFRGSPDIVDYAIERGWYEPDSAGLFHFARSYSDRKTLFLPVNTQRMWRGVNLLSKQKYDINDEFPFSFEPARKISQQDLMAVLRDHYEGTQFDLSNGYTLGSPNIVNGHAICAETTQYGFVAQLRQWLPAAIGNVIWLAQRRPDSQAFIPWYFGIDQIPAGYAYGDYRSALENHFNLPQDYYQITKDHAFWTFARLAATVDENYATMIDSVRQRWNDLEQALLSKQTAFEKSIHQVYQESPVKAKTSLTEFTTKWATTARQMADELMK